jgi:hypothetical protein
LAGGLRRGCGVWCDLLNAMLPSSKATQPVHNLEPKEKTRIVTAVPGYPSVLLSNVPHLNRPLSKSYVNLAALIIELAQYAVSNMTTTRHPKSLSPLGRKGL